ncbi:MAG: protein kinase [Muribaculaceae bacterium]|nr:protein kinase [Muribaculaceae bacterium]
MNNKEERWTEIEHLPKWDEEFYDVYTAKKFGKWVMLKTLKDEFKGKPEFEAMFEKEFDTRYNLAHPNIVMINDFEDVPGIGRCIITDDVYGDSLRSLINENKVTKQHVEKLKTQFLSALEYIQSNHIAHLPIKSERIIFTENIGNLKLIDVGFEQRPALTPEQATDDIRNFGNIVLETLDKSGINEPMLRKVAERCADTDNRRRYHTIHDVRLALENRHSNRLYIAIIAFLIIMIGLLAWLSSPYKPAIPTMNEIENADTK